MDLQNISWDEIKAIAVTNANPSCCFTLGATKTVMVNSKNHITRIIDFNHDDLANGSGKAGITFEFANLLTTSGGYADITKWNEKGASPTNRTYSESTLNDFLNDRTDRDSVINKFPDNLKKEGMIEEVYKPVAETENYEINTTYTTKLFPLSYREITASEESLYAKEEGATYAFYTGSGDSQTNRIKNIVDGVASWYWLRSPYTLNNNIAWICDFNGHFDCNTGVINRELALAPSFCV